MENIVFAVRNETEIKVIRFNSLLAITVDNYLCTFHIENEDKFTCTKKLNEVEKILPEHFVKIRRNTIINSHKIKSLHLKDKKILLDGEHSFKYVAKNVKSIKLFTKFGITI